MKKFVLGGAILLLAFAIASCCSCRRGKSNPVSILNVKWGLVELNGTSVDRGGVDSDRFSFTLDPTENRATGMGNCNRFFGGYTLKDGGYISFDQMGSTRMFCPNQELETQFLQTLEKVSRYDVDGDFLIMMDDNRNILASFRSDK